MSKAKSARSEEFYSNIAKIEEYIEAYVKVGNVSIDFNGHFSFEKEILFSEIYLGLLSFSEEALKLLAKGQKLSEPQVMHLHVRCPYCADYLKFYYDGETFKVFSACKYPGGFKSVSIELNIPSGKMVFANDLRNWFKIHGDFNVNFDIGILQTIQAYEKIGMAHGFIGNTCPSVYKKSKKVLSISASPIKDIWDKENKKYVIKDKAQIKLETPPGKKVGGICTDLWWYCIVDYEDFKNRFIDISGSQEDFEKYIKDHCNVVHVDPGMYIVRHFFVRGYDVPEAEPLHYAKITWNRSPEKRNLYEQYKKMNRTIGQCYLAAVAEYPSLYGFEEEELPQKLTHAERVEKIATYPSEILEKSFQRFLNYIFCTLGSGIEWHQNGWGATEVAEDVPDFPMPILTKPYKWYPMSRQYCTLYLAAFNKCKYDEKIHLNESFLAAAYNVIHSMLRYGTETISSFNHSNVDKKVYDETYKKEIQEQQKIAEECLNGLAKHYPGSVPEYCKDMLFKT